MNPSAIETIVKKYNKPTVYDLLGVDPHINANELSVVYPSLPIFKDASVGITEQEKTDLYKALSDPVVRQHYDQSHGIVAKRSPVATVTPSTSSVSPPSLAVFKNGPGGAGLLILGLLSILDVAKYVLSSLTGIQKGDAQSTAKFPNVVTNIVDRAVEFERMATDPDPNKNLAVKLAKSAAALGYTLDTVSFASSVYLEDLIENILKVFEKTMTKVIQTGSNLINTSIAGIPVVGSIFALVSSVLRIAELLGVTVAGAVEVGKKVSGVVKTLTNLDVDTSKITAPFQDKSIIPLDNDNPSFKEFTERIQEAMKNQAKRRLEMSDATPSVVGGGGVGSIKKANRRMKEILRMRSQITKRIKHTMKRVGKTVRHRRS